MPKKPSVTVDGVIERKHPEMPAFVVVPASKVAKWKIDATATVEGTLDSAPIGRRSIHRWDDDRWFVELPRGLLDTIGKAPGARARLTIALASTELPPELQSVLDEVPAARVRWEAATDAQRRMLREHVLGAKSPEARERRARRELLPAARPPAPRVAGLGAAPVAVAVRIFGRNLPGRSCGPYSEVTVGFADVTFPADVREARWETRIQVSERDGAPAFRGGAVNGPPAERFFYLTWIGRKGREAPAMFRRTKLRLDAVPPDVLAGAIRTGVLVARLDLTACDGMPIAASVRPPEIDWSFPP